MAPNRKDHIAVMPRFEQGDGQMRKHFRQGKAYLAVPPDGLNSALAEHVAISGASEVTAQQQGRITPHSFADGLCPVRTQSHEEAACDRDHRAMSQSAGEGDYVILAVARHAQRECREPSVKRSPIRLSESRARGWSRTT